MAACLGVELDALPSITDPQALIDCGIEVLAGAAPMPDDPPDVAETIVFPTTVVVSEG
jgi:hypothetical protein